MAQYRNGDAANIKQRFDRGESSILLGTGSFWEGVDFSQQKEVIQIITRLPFDNPKDYMVQKLNTKLREQGKNPFYDYSLPVAILRLKTGYWENQPFSRSGISGPLIGSAGGNQAIWKNKFWTGCNKVLPLHTTLRERLVEQAADFF